MRPLLAGAGLLVVVLGGCATWTPQGLTPQAVIEKDHPEQVRVTRRNGSRVELRTPVIVGDSMHGETKVGRTGVALEDISYLSLNRGNRPVTAALTGIGVAAGLVALLAATWNQ